MTKVWQLPWLVLDAHADLYTKYLSRYLGVDTCFSFISTARRRIGR